MKPAKYFLNLKVLSICNTKIEKIEGLNSLKTITELYLSENFITKIEGLQGLSNLKKLNLSYNKIKTLEGLNELFSLTFFWINENLIETIEGVEGLVNIKELSIAQNLIKSLGNGLDHLESLEKLNLSGNPISSFKEIFKLCKLRKLADFCLSDPNFGESVLCTLSNYQTFVLYYLKQLTSLDCMVITNESRSHAETTFLKKKLYYTMKKKISKRSLASIIKKISQEALLKQTPSWDYILNLLKVLKNIEREIDERAYSENPGKGIFLYGDQKAQSNPLDSLSDQDLSNLLNTNHSWLITKIKDEYQKICGYNRVFRCLTSKIENWGKNIRKELESEFHEGGNLKYEEGNENDSWYKSCCDLVSSRYNNGIDVSVTRVVRIHNRMLRNRFEDKLESLADVSETYYRRNIDYLFYGGDNLEEIVVEGFKTPKEYAKDGLPGCIPLSYSLETADIERLRRLYEEYDDVHEIYWPKGQVLLCKVYFGKGKGDLRVPYYQSDMTPKEIWELCSFNPPNICWAVYRTHECDSKQRVWFIFDNALVLPEYLIEFEYSSDAFPVGNHLLDPSLLSLSKPIDAFYSENLESEKLFDENITSLIPNRVLIDHSETVIKKVIKGPKAEYLNLHNLNIQAIDQILPFTNLTTLILSQNNLDSISSISLLISLIKLDISFNNISKLDGLKPLESLTELDAHNNNIWSLGEIRKIPNSLTKLTSFQNPVYWDLRYEEVIFSLLPSLILLDWRNISKCTKKSAVLEIDINLIKTGLFLPMSGFDNFCEFFSNLEVVEIENCKLLTMKAVNQCKNLKRLSLAGNFIVDIEDLGLCEQLEDLNLSNNFIQTVFGKNFGLKLKNLELSYNQITTILDFSHLDMLNHLGIESNFISTIGILSEMQSIIELYLSNNLLNDIKEIFQLKKLQNLVVLDVFGNNCMETPKSRLVLIYNLSNLKVLNGQTIDSNEVLQAKQEFDGILTDELLEKRSAGLKLIELRQLDLSNSKLRNAENMFTADLFPKLLELNLSYNLFSNLMVFGYLPMLAKLDLSYNKVESFVCGPKGFSSLPNLEILNLSFNSFSTFAGLQQAQLKNLRIFYVSHNNIAKIDFIEFLTSLREIDISYNKIRNIEKKLELPNIRSVNFDNNGLKNLNFLENLMWIQAIKASNNRISDLSDIEKIQGLPSLLELILTANPIEKKVGYRHGIIRKIPNLLFLDGKEVTGEEKGEFLDMKKPSIPIGVGKLASKMASITLDAYFLKIHPKTANSQNSRKRE